METIVFERRGGLAGMNQRLEITQGEQMTVSTQGQKLKSWSMSASEVAAFAALEKAADLAPVPQQSPEAATTSDTFEYRLFVGTSDKPRFKLRSVSLTPSDDSPWGILMAYCNHVLTQNLSSQPLDLVDPSVLK